MAKPSNPLGTSTGLGKGEAQVFGDTYSSFFKDKLAQAEKKDKELKDAMAKASDMSQLWSRDVAAFKPMVNEYQNFVRENARALIKGDFDATVKNQQMMNDLTQYASSSKEAQKFFNDMLKSAVNNPDKFYSKDLDRIREFGSSTHSGDFDYSKYPVRPKIDMSAIQEKLQKAVSNFGTTPGGVEVVEAKNADGEVVGTYLKSREGNLSLDLNKLVESERMAATGFFGQEQVDEEFNQDVVNNLLKTLPNFLELKENIKILPPDRGYYASGRGQQKLKTASLMKQFIAQSQNYIKGKTESALDVLTNLKTPNGVIRRAYHSNSSEDLKNKYKEGKVIIEYVKDQGTVKERIVTEVLDTDRFDVFYDLFKKSNKFSDVDKEDLEEVPEYEFSKEDRQKLEGQEEVTGAVDEYDSLISFFKNPLETVKEVEPSGYDSNTKSYIINKSQSQITPFDAMAEKLKGKTVGQNYDSKAGGKIKSITKEKGVIKVNFEGKRGDGASERYNYIEFKPINGSYNTSKFIKEALNYFPEKTKASSSKTETKEEKTQLPESVIQNWLKKNKLTDTKANRDKAIKSYEEYKKTKNQKTKQN